MKRNDKTLEAVTHTHTHTPYVYGIIIILIIALVAFFIMYKSGAVDIIKNRFAEIKKEEDADEENEIVTNAYYEIISTNNDKYNIAITIENENGIEGLTDSEVSIKCSDRTKLAVDRTLTEGEEYWVKIKIKGKEEEELLSFVATNKLEEAFKLETNPTDDENIREVQIMSADSNLIYYYSIDDGVTWNMCEEKFDIEAVYANNIQIKRISSLDETIFDKNENTKPSSITHNDESLLMASKNVIKNSGYYNIKVNDELYTIHAYVYDGDTIFSTSKTFGDANDVATASAYAKNMVVVKIDGDLTINSGVTLTAYGTSYGGPKGMLIYSTGTLTNNGTISMTARGAKAVGQNVYLWKNKDTTNNEYEFVPKDGASGGANRSTVGYNAGGTGTDRKTRWRRFRLQFNR